MNFVEITKTMRRNKAGKYQLKFNNIFIIFIEDMDIPPIYPNCRAENWFV